MKVVHPSKISIILEVRKETFSNFLMYMGDMANLVLGQIAKEV
tara:strand:- start:453 stop:581 length:129 start_codon:yes stop_codon:yes gene_type:complete